MSFGNAFVGAVLRSPVHALLSGSTDLVRFTGRRSGRTFTTPTQYARRGDHLVILVARPESKTWWRNFTSDRPIEVLVRGTWLPMTARAVVGEQEPDAIAPLLSAYLDRFPKAERALPGAGPDDRACAAVIVWCRPA